ncbi:MAG: phosphatase PAP2 family protein [Bdellovibrionales bacterium]|nr:phosphatase PAP2 family protein [Bdellovibrionales bacterium]
MNSLKQLQVLTIVVLLLLLQACGSSGSSSNTSQQSGSWLLRWNAIAIDASGRDHTVGGGAHQFGPTKSSRAMAIVHIAMFEALNGTDPAYESFLGIEPADPSANAKVAIAQAAHDTLSALYPTQRTIFDEALAEDDIFLSQETGYDRGKAYGAQVAELALLSREGDGSELSTTAAEERYPFSTLPGRWRKDPLNPDQTPLGSLWKNVAPFVLTSASQFRSPPPPSLSSVEYAEAFAEAYRIGGDGVITPTERTPEQTETGIFWAYDGTPSLCAPPRLYNQLAVRIAEQRGVTDIKVLARMLALVNVAMADAAISIWEAKYYYDFWRPITAIREAEVGTGPTGRGDGNPLTVGDTEFTPLGAPASNLAKRDFTPPFPTYPSGHAGFGGAVFEVLRQFYGTDDVPFSFVSDEFNGITAGSDGIVRPVRERFYNSFSEAEEENGQSRIYLGIHFAFDKTSAISQGRNVGRFIYNSVFRPLPTEATTQ